MVPDDMKITRNSIVTKEIRTIFLSFYDKICFIGLALESEMQTEKWKSGIGCDGFRQALNPSKYRKGIFLC